MKTFGDVDSKFRFVILASKRAKQLLKGARPKVKGRSKNPIRIAQTELKMGLVDYEILPGKKEEGARSEEQVFLGDELRGESDGGGADVSDKDEGGGYEGSEQDLDEEAEGSSEERDEEESDEESGEDKD